MVETPRLGQLTVSKSIVSGPTSQTTKSPRESSPWWRSRTESSRIVRDSMAEYFSAFSMTLYQHRETQHIQDDATRNPSTDAVFEQFAWFQIALSCIADGVLATDAAGRVTYLNPVAEALTGWTLAEAAGRTIEDVFRIVHETTRKPVVQPVRKAIEQRQAVGLANHTILIARNGAERTIDDSASPIQDARGEILGGVLIFRDITARRREEIVRERASRQATFGAAIGAAFARGPSLGAMLKASTDAVVTHLDASFARIWTLDAAGTTLELQASSGLYTHIDGPHGRVPVGAFKIGRIAEERKAHLSNDVANDPRVSDQDWAQREGMVAFAGYPLVVEERLVGVLALFARQPLADDTLAALGSVADIIAIGIERKETEEALQRSEEFNRRIVASSPDCIKVLDAEGRLLALNENGCRLMEVDDFATLAHQDWASLWPLASRAAVEAAIKAAQAGGSMTFRGPCPTAKGTPKWWDVAVVPILDSHGRLERILSVSRDITAAMQADELRESQAEALRQADRRKNEFLAMLAHELRNPLAAVGNAVQVLRQAGDLEHLEWANDVINRQVAHLVRLIDDLMDVSRITEGKLRLKKEVFPLKTAIDRAVEVVSPLMERLNHAFTVSVPAPPIALDADPARVGQMLNNLLTNAAKYTERGGNIALNVERSEGDVAIRIRDSGMGISAEMLQGVFGLYTQVAGSLDHSQGGLGIGLSLVKSLAEMHGGSVSATSDGPGRGSEFVLRLPVIEDMSAPAPHPVVRTRGAKSASRVLVVDDNPDTARGMVRLLKLAGHEVKMALDGKTALVLARELGPDAVLLDIGLPDMDGYAVARELRQYQGCEHALLIAVSGYGQEEDLRRARSAGFDYHLVKPVDFDELMGLLERNSPWTG
jgi:PAS domain S-box-containing protein